MEYIEQIWLEVRRRLSGPFVGSFSLSFIAYHWKVLLILFWYGNDELKEHYPNCDRIEVIELMVSWEGFWIPLSISVVLMFLLPMLNGWSQVVITVIRNWSRGVEENVGRKGLIRSSIYFDRVKELDEVEKQFKETQDQLEKKQADAYSNSAEITKLMGSVESLTKELTLKNEEIESINKSSDVSFLEGEWYWQFETGRDGNRIDYHRDRIKIKNGKWLYYSEDRARFIHLGNLKSVKRKDNNITFTKVFNTHDWGKDSRSFYVEMTLNEYGYYEGSENLQLSIELRPVPKEDRLIKET